MLNLIFNKTKFVLISLVLLVVLGTWGYIKLLQHKVNSAETSAAVKPVETGAEIIGENANEEIEKIEKEFYEAVGLADDNTTEHTDNVDWMFK